jgi:hypothetical protein
MHVSLTYDKNYGTSHEGVFTFMTIPRWVFLRLRNGLDKIYRENESTHFFSNNIFRKSCVYEVMSKNFVAPESPQVTVQYGANALHAGKASVHAHTHMHTPISLDTHSYTHTRAYTHTHTHKRTHIHTEICATYSVFHGSIVTLCVNCLSCLIPLSACIL